MNQTVLFPHIAQSLVWGLQNIFKEEKQNVLSARGWKEATDAMDTP